MPITAGLNPEFGLVVSGHTHRFYTCTLPTRGGTAVVTSAGNNGQIITNISYALDRRTGKFADVKAQNVIVENGVRNADGTWQTRDGVFVTNPALVDPGAKALADKYRTAVAPIANETPSPTVAQWSYATRRLLVELLERSRRFVVVDPEREPAEKTLVLRFVDVRDEVFNESVVYGREQLTGVQRRAVVEMEWSAGGAPELLISHDYSPGSVPLALAAVTAAWLLLR